MGMVARMIALCCVLIAFAAADARVGGSPRPASARNMKLIGHHDLSGRSSYMPVAHFQHGRWMLYVGHQSGAALNPLTQKMEPNGVSILDVTDPAHPLYLAHIVGPAHGGAQHVRVCDGVADKSRTYALVTYGRTAHRIYEVTDPRHPLLVSEIGDLEGTHKSAWECDTGVAYLTSGAKGWRAAKVFGVPVNTMMLVYDLSDPAHPKLIRPFGLVGQQPGADGPVPGYLHEPFSAGLKKERLYVAYGATDHGIVQIIDRAKLLGGDPHPSPESLNAPVIARVDLPAWQGAHTAMPLPEIELPRYARYPGPRAHRFMMVVGEDADPSCLEQQQQLLLFYDITDEAHPLGISTFAVNDPEGCRRGGRFGPHGFNEDASPLFSGKLVFLTYFNAGVRVIDVRDPYHPKEVGSYIPAVSDRSFSVCAEFHAADPRCNQTPTIQTNNVETDPRGYIYIVDRAGAGLDILRLSGRARQIAGVP